MDQAMDLLQSQREALDALMARMPPVVAMRARVVHEDARSLWLAAPLAANVNDKGSAYGGSLVSLLTLAGWCLVTLRLMRAGLDADVYVAESQVQYLKPLLSDLQVCARAADGAEWDLFCATVRSRGRARIAVLAEAPMPDGGIATACQSRYAAILRR